MGEQWRHRRKQKQQAQRSSKWSKLKPRPGRRWRWDVPKRRKQASQAKAGVDRDEEAISAVLEDRYTATSGKSVNARLAWWDKVARLRGLAAFPLDTEKLTVAGAVLKRGKFRSASQYLYSMKKEHVSRGHAWSEALPTQ